MFLCRCTLFRIIITITVVAIILLLYCHSEKKVAVISKHYRYHDYTISKDSTNHSLKLLHLLYCHYYFVLPSNSLSRDLLFCRNITNRGVNKITDMEKAHRLRFGVLLQQAFTCKSISYY